MCSLKCLIEPLRRRKRDMHALYDRRIRNRDGTSLSLYITLGGLYRSSFDIMMSYLYQNRVYYFGMDAFRVY